MAHFFNSLDEFSRFFDARLDALCDNDGFCGPRRLDAASPLPIQTTYKKAAPPDAGGRKAMNIKMKTLAAATAAAACAAGQAHAGFLEAVIDTTPAGYVSSSAERPGDFGSFWQDTVRGAKAIMKEADFPYLSCNWVDLRTTLRVLPSVKVFVRGGRRIAFVGVTTPETFTKSTPAYFMNDAQTKYIYDILGGEDGQKLYDAVQEAIDKAEFWGADTIIGLGHLGVDPSSSPWTSEEVIAHTHGFTAFIDGHSHTVMANKQVTDASGKAVTLTQTGSYFKNIGKMTVGADGTITTELIDTYEGLDAAVAATASNWISAVDDMLGEEIAVGDTKFYINDPATGKRRIRSGETNLGDFVADGIYTYFNEIEELHCDVAIMNGGGIRTDVEAGPWSFKTCKTVSPFGNVACLMSVTGQQIQDALEFGARFAGAEGKENGGFLQVAGARYTIHPMIPNTVQTNDKNVWTGSAATPRVSNVEIYDKTTGTYQPLDPNATYALAGMNYTLRNLGDGFAMFDGATLIKDYVSEDYLVMSSYAAMFGGVDANGLPHLASANSPLADYPGYMLNYEDPYGAGRIQMIW